MTRTITIPAFYMGRVDALLTVEPCERPFPLEDREYVRMTLTVLGRVVADGAPFGTGVGGCWDDRSDAEVAGTFGSFLAHALESREDDARDGWTVLADDADEWTDSLTLMAENA